MLSRWRHYENCNNWELILLGLKLIGPLQDPVTWYGINYVGARVTFVGISKQRNVELDWYQFLFFLSRTAKLAPSIIFSEPCEWIVQWAHYPTFKVSKNVSIKNVVTVSVLWKRYSLYIQTLPCSARFCK